MKDMSWRERAVPAPRLQLYAILTRVNGAGFCPLSAQDRSQTFSRSVERDKTALGARDILNATSRPHTHRASLVAARPALLPSSPPLCIPRSLLASSCSPLAVQLRYAASARQTCVSMVRRDCTRGTTQRRNQSRPAKSLVCYRAESSAGRRLARDLFPTNQQASTRSPMQQSVLCAVDALAALTAVWNRREHDRIVDEHTTITATTQIDRRPVGVSCGEKLLQPTTRPRCRRRGAQCIIYTTNVSNPRPSYSNCATYSSTPPSRSVRRPWSRT